MLQKIQAFNRINLTQRHATLSVLALYVVGSAIAMLAELFTPTRFHNTIIILAPVGTLIFGTAWFLYYRNNWEPAPYLATLATTLMVGLFLPEPFLTREPPLSILLPTVLALLLTNPLWVVINALLVLGILLGRAGWVGVYTDPITLTIYGMVIGGLLVSRLITEMSLRRLRAAQEIIQQDEIRFATAFHANPTPQVISHLDSGRILDVNEAYCQLLGFQHDEVIGHTSLELGVWLNPEDRANIVQQLNLNQKVHNVELSFVTRSREIRKLLVSYELIELKGEQCLIANALDITERDRDQQHIQYQANLLANVSDAIIASNMQANITSWNRAAEKIYGWREDEVLGITVSTILKTEYENTSPEQVRQHFLGEGLWQGEVTQARKDGTRLVILSSVSLVRDRNNEPVAMVAVNRDITERKRAEQLLERQNQRLKVLRELDSAILASDTIENITAAALEHIRDLIDCDRASLVLIDWGLQKATIFDVRTSHQTVHSKGFQVPLATFEGLLQILANNQPIVLNNLKETPDLPPQIQSLANEGFSSLSVLPLFSQGKLIGIFSMSSLSTGFFEEDKVNLGREVANQVAIAISQSRLIANLQQLNAELEQRVAERTAELNQLNLELQHANRAKDEFLSTMSHELRTPLNSILGLSESLLEQVRDPLSERQQKSLQIIESSGQHLLELINDILDLAKIDAGKFSIFPQDVDIGPLCLSSLAFIRQQALKKSITLTFEEDPNATKLQADPRRMKQILVNLLTNAVKFTPAGGQVILRVQAEAQADTVKFSISDNGIGIAPEDLKRLFQPFVQVDSRLTRQFEGTGLGLALVQKLADLHGGSVEVESVLNQGSRFIVTLPWQSALVEPRNDPLPKIAPPTEEESATPMTPEPTDRKVILLAEDNATNILTFSEYLEDRGYQVVVAHDGWEALARAEENSLDLILMDIQMPGLDGLETIQRLRANPRFATTPIIALTALTMPGDRELCLQAGASEYMSKPVSLKNLATLIANLLNPSI